MASLSDLEKNGLEIIENQSFLTEFEKWGKLRFVSAKKNDGGTTKLSFYLVDNNDKIIYTFLNFYGNNWSELFKLKALSFKDVNKDGLKDVIIVAEYITGVGPTGAIPFSIGSIYFQSENSFINIPELDERINSAKKNENIDMIIEYVTSNSINLK